MFSRAASLDIERALQPADRVRARFYRLLGPLVAPWVRNRERRTALLGVLTIASAAVIAIGAPLWLLALGPIVLGVPHVLADIRYLWVQPGFHKRLAVWLVVVPGLVIGAVTAQVAWGLLAAMLALFVAPSSGSRRALWTRRAIGIGVLLPLAVLAVRWSGPATLIYAHAHNLIAVGLWWAMWRRKQRWHWLVLGLFVGLSVLIGSGAADAGIEAGTALFGTSVGGREFALQARRLAPWADAASAPRLLVLYVFAQSVHYVIWLRLVPEEARTRSSPRPFRSSYRALRSELGLPLLAMAVLSALVIAIWATVDLWSARSGYLRAAVFHGHLELVAAALLFARGRRARDGA